MSSTRSRNRICRSLDDSFTSTSSSTAYFKRWSEVMPQKTALTFAALWDPEEGMVTFSGAELLGSESLSEPPLESNAPNNDGDYSQGISMDRENSATLGAFQDAFKAFLHRTPRQSVESLHVKAGKNGSRCLHSRASSTFDGLDIYSHDVQVKPKRSLQLSSMNLLDMESSFPSPAAFGGLRLGSSSMVGTYRSDSGTDLSSESRLANLKSRFSTTTTSTSNYVDVASSAIHGFRLPEVSPPLNWAGPDECISPANSWPYLPRRRRRLLRKHRPLDVNATPSTSSLPSTPRKIARWMAASPSPSHSVTGLSPRTDMISGEERRGRFPLPIGGPGTETPTKTPTPPDTPFKSPRLRLPFTFLKRKSSKPSSDSDGWVCIEVAPTIVQHYVANMDDD